MFTPRTASQVESLAGSLRQQEQAAAEWAQFVADLQAAQQQARADKPGEAAWRAGPHGARLAAVAAFASDALPLSCPERSLASKTLADLGKSPSGHDAAALLQSIGWWEPHLQLNLLAAGISEQFDEALEVGCPCWWRWLVGWGSYVTFSC